MQKKEAKRLENLQNLTFDASTPGLLSGNASVQDKGPDMEFKFVERGQVDDEKAQGPTEAITLMPLSEDKGLVSEDLSQRKQETRR